MANNCNITINGQPLADFIGEGLAVEIETIRVDVIGKLTKSIYHPPKSKLNTGRTSGKPKGLKRAKVYSKDEVAAVNAQRGLRLVR